MVGLYPRAADQTAPKALNSSNFLDKPITLPSSTYMPPSDCRLVLNVARLSFESQELAATRLPINSENDFASLTAEYSGTHLVRRFDDHNVLVIPLVKGAPEVVGTSTKVGVGEDPGLVAALARHALTNYLKSLGRSITWGRPHVSCR
jgi:hypothetical protein